MLYEFPGLASCRRFAISIAEKLSVPHRITVKALTLDVVVIKPTVSVEGTSDQISGCVKVRDEYTGTNNAFIRLNHPLPVVTSLSEQWQQH